MGDQRQRLYRRRDQRPVCQCHSGRERFLHAETHALEAESFKANSPLLATFTTDTATLFLDNQSYDAVPNQLAAEIQSPLDAPNQRVATVGLQGDLTRSTVTGAAQIGTGLMINGNEKPTGSFVSWLNGNCQAQAVITATTPRVPNGMNGLIPKGQVGTMQGCIGAGVGLLLTPRTASWPGIRALHKTGSTASHGSCQCAERVERG